MGWKYVEPYRYGQDETLTKQTDSSIEKLSRIDEYKGFQVNQASRYQGIKDRAYRYDNKKMGLPDDVTVYDESAHKYQTDKNYKPSSLRLMKNLGDYTYLNVDAKVNDDGSMSPTRRWISKSSSFTQDALGTAAMALAFVPGVNAAVGGLFGLSGAAGAAAGGALINGSMAAIGGGDPIRAAVTGSLGGLVPGISNQLVGAGLDQTLANVVSRGAVGGVRSAVSGGDFIHGAIMNNIPGVNTGNSLVDRITNIVVRRGAGQLLSRQG